MNRDSVRQEARVWMVVVAVGTVTLGWCASAVVADDGRLMARPDRTAGGGIPDRAMAGGDSGSPPVDMMMAVSGHRSYGGCGDGIIQIGEDCDSSDPGDCAAGCYPPSHEFECRCIGVCGNGQVDVDVNASPVSGLPAGSS